MRITLKDGTYREVAFRSNVVVMISSADGLITMVGAGHWLRF